MNVNTISTNHYTVLAGITGSLFIPDTIPQEKPQTLFTNEAIIKGLKERNSETIRYIYKVAYPQIRYFVTTNSGTIMDAEDVFQDAIVIIYKKVDSNLLYLTSSFTTFINSICRHLWLQKINKNKPKVEYDDNLYIKIEDKTTDWDDLQNESEKFLLFQKHFNRLKPDEQKVLKLYCNKTPSKEIARIMGYKSDKYAKFRKYLCKEKLKNMIVNDEIFPQLFQCV